MFNPIELYDTQYHDHITKESFEKKPFTRIDWPFENI